MFQDLALPSRLRHYALAAMGYINPQRLPKLVVGPFPHDSITDSTTVALSHAFQPPLALARYYAPSYTFRIS